jgi:tripeptidyl-peptidase-1
MTTPDVLQSRYGYSPLTTAANGNSVSVTEFQFQYYDNVDLEAFSDACGVEVDVDTTIGGNKDYICTKIGGCIEALLDIEYIGAVSSPIPLTVIYQQDYSLLDWVDSVINMDKPPLVHSVSYGNDEVQQTSSEYMDSCNTQFQIAGSLGLSILFASGDQGVWGRSGPGKTFHPDFPAGSPYITAVGGTNFQTKSKIGNETTWNCAGGGFSDQFPRPSWQDSQVNNYLKTAPLPSTSLFNENGRGYPDISALAGQTNPYCVAVKGGDFMGVAGTSASCPVIGGLIGQLNDLRLKAGKPSLGWLNPFLYSADAAKCFYDVNDGSTNNCLPGTEGFTAENGWDPATGLGTPNFKCLASLVIV